MIKKLIHLAWDLFVKEKREIRRLISITNDIEHWVTVSFRGKNQIPIILVFSIDEQDGDVLHGNVIFSWM